MPKCKLDSFNTTFWTYYKKKQLKQIINNIPKLLKIKYEPENEEMYLKLCTHSIIALVDKALNDKTVVEVPHMTAICFKYQSVAASTNDPITALKYFICLEYLRDLSNTPEEVRSQLVANLALVVLNKITKWKHSWTDTDRTILNRFIVVLVELESQLLTPTFTLAQEAINFFSTITTDQRKTAYPEYLLTTLKFIMSYREENVDSFGEFVNISSLSANENYIKDVAIMMSQIIRATTSLISNGSLVFKQNVGTMLIGLYKIIRNKNLSACQYIFRKTYDEVCCHEPHKHASLQIMETVRTIVVEAIKKDNFDEYLVSIMSNVATAEAEIISHFDCAAREHLKEKLWETFSFIQDDIGKIVTTCGLDKAKRTLQKCLAINSLERLHCVDTIDVLMDICKDADNRAEKISWTAMRFMFSTDQKSRIYHMFELHELQSELNDPNQFETISSIVKGLPKKKYSVDLDAIQLQLLQITVEIDYPRLSAMCLQKLADDMCEMDFYKSDHRFKANLCKSGVCYVQFLAHMQQYQSNVKYDHESDPLNRKFVSLKKEVEIVGKLKGALDYLAEFIRDTDAWLGKVDSADYIIFAERLMKEISETLINRHYKDLSVTAFELFYKFAKLIDQPVNQLIAAGYLVENIHLASTISEKEIVTALRSNIMQKLKDVNFMSEDELGSFLFGFLQLTMYTMRHQCNMEDAKKYMQAINKLLNKYDSEKAKYLPARLKHAEVLFELIVKNPDTTITPVTFIEDIFHRFKEFSVVSWSDNRMVPGVILDLLITLHEFTEARYELRYQPRYERYYTSLLMRTIHFTAIRNGYLLVFTKVTILECREALLVNGEILKTFMEKLDVLFDCPNPALPTETNGETITWNKDISPLIHPIKCKCFQCTNKFINTLTMDVATLKALSFYFKKEYENSLASFERIHNHWTASNTLSYSSMLMHYSNCLILNQSEDKSNAILRKALGVCNDCAQQQDICFRLLLSSKKKELIVDEPYADEVRPKAVKRKNESSLPAAKKICSKRSYLRNYTR